MARNSKAAQLGRVQIFSACTDRELTQIASAVDERKLDAGVRIVEQGSTGHELFLIVTGEAQVIRDGDLIVTLGPGAYFGELALLDGSPRGASVESRTPMSVLVLGQREFIAVLDQWPAVARKMLSQMASRLRAAESNAASH